MTANGMTYTARVTQTPTGTVLVADNGVPTPLASVDTIDDESRLLGAAQGLGLGFLLGAGAGIAIGFAAGDDPPCDVSGHVCDLNPPDTAGNKAALGGIVLGVLGGLVGAIVGTVRGQHDVWHRGPPAPAPLRPTGPPGSVVGLSVAF